MVLLVEENSFWFLFSTFFCLFISWANKFFSNYFVSTFLSQKVVSDNINKNCYNTFVMVCRISLVFNSKFESKLISNLLACILMEYVSSSVENRWYHPFMPKYEILTVFQMFPSFHSDSAMTHEMRMIWEW